jgi:predicted dinucleotide-binding enzyme
MGTKLLISAFQKNYADGLDVKRRSDKNIGIWLCSNTCAAAENILTLSDVS